MPQPRCPQRVHVLRDVTPPLGVFLNGMALASCFRIHQERCGLNMTKDSSIDAAGRLDEKMFRLDSRVAIVTGGGGAIGGVICKLFANVGAAVAFIDLDAERVNATASQIEADGGRAIGIACDVGAESQSLSAVARVVSESGSLTVLVNVAAAMDRSGTVLDIDLQEWERVQRVNLTGAYPMSRECLRA
jgi:hypothetical protein